MIFESAINILHQNRAVKRAQWDFSIRLEGDQFVWGDIPFVLSTADILARDWMAA